MKRILLGLALLTFTTNVNAQDAADKKVQAGLVMGYGMNFQKMGTDYLEKGGVGSDMTIGANVNFGFTETIGFSTGIEFDFESLKYNTPGGDTIMYAYNTSDKNLIRVESEADLLALDGTENYYRLASRKQKPLYISIPTMLVFRTNFIGYFRYFGKFGLRTSVLVSNKFTDQGSNIDMTDGSVMNNDENKDMKAKSEMFFLKSAVGLSGGAEWNFIGSTSLMAEIGYYYGFTPLYNKRTYMMNTGGENNTTGGIDFFANKASQSQLMFKVSVLF